jgi:hypothetical protein
LDFAVGAKMLDLLAYFAGGYVVSVKQSVGGVEYNEDVAIPKCAEPKVAEAAAAAVKAGHLWVTNGMMSFCGEEPPAGTIAKSAVLRLPPVPVPMTALTPEELPDAWTDGVTTALALHNAASAKFAPQGTILPWSVLCAAVNDALNTRYLEVLPGGPVQWPCEAQSAAKVEFRLPEAGPDKKKPPIGEGPVAVAQLDSAGLIALVDALADVQAAVAAYGTSLTFRVTVEAPGLPPTARQALRGELTKAAAEFAGSA